MGEGVRFDGMNEGARFTHRRNQIKPAPRCQVTALFADSGDVARDGIQSAKVVQQPRVNPVFFQRVTNGCKVEQRRGNGAGSGHSSSIDGGPKGPHYKSIPRRYNARMAGIL